MYSVSYVLRDAVEAAEIVRSKKKQMASPYLVSRVPKNETRSKQIGSKHSLGFFFFFGIFLYCGKGKKIRSVPAS